jgi:hypothetical protein
MDDRADVARLKTVGHDEASENNQIKLVHHISLPASGRIGGDEAGPLIARLNIQLTSAPQ